MTRIKLLLSSLLLLTALAIVTSAPVQAQTESSARRLHQLLIDAGMLSGTQGQTSGVCLLTGGAGCIMTGTLRGSAGTAALPSHTFSGDTDTGLYSVGANQVGVSTGGALRATFASTGLNLETGEAHSIAGTSVLNATTLGTGVVTSSLTTVGALGAGSITSGFGAIDVGADAITTTGLVTAGTLAVGGGTAVVALLTNTASLDFAGVTDSCESLTVTVTGATANNGCSVGSPLALPSVTSWVSCFVSAADTVTVRHCAHGASGDPAAATYRAVVTKY